VIVVLLVLEEHIRALHSADKVRVQGVESTITKTLDGITIDQLGDGVVLGQLDLADFVRSTETIEEVHERNATLQSGKVSDESHIGDFLNGLRVKISEAASTSSHDIVVIGEDGQRLATSSTRSNVDDKRLNFTSNLEHVGDHEKKTLAASEGAHDSTGDGGTVDSTGHTSLRLHGAHIDLLAPNVLTASLSPEISQLTHGSCRGDWEQERNVTQCISNMSGCLITINTLQELNRRHPF